MMIPLSDERVRHGATPRVVLLGPSLVRAGCAAYLAGEDGFEVVASAMNINELPDDLDVVDHRPLVAVVIVGDIDGTRVEIERVVADGRFDAVLPVLTVADPTAALAALAAGSSGCVLLDDGPVNLIAAIPAAGRGELPMSPAVGRWVVGQWMRRTETPRLTAREREVLDLVGAGLGNKQIARRLGISQPTVKHHLTRVFQRIGVSGRTEAALWLQRQELSGPSLVRVA